MIIFGGQFHSTNNTNELNTFEFAKNLWVSSSFLPTEVPYVDGHNAVVYEGEMIVFGGFIGGTIGKYSNLVYKFNFQNRKWTLVQPQIRGKELIKPRALASVCLH